MQDKSNISKKAKQYGFTDTEYQQLLECTFDLAQKCIFHLAEERKIKTTKKQIDEIADLLISKKSSDRQKGFEQLKAVAYQDSRINSL